MKYSDYVKYGNTHITKGDVNLDDLTDGYRTIAQYRKAFFTNLIKNCKRAIKNVCSKYTPGDSAPTLIIEDLKPEYVLRGDKMVRDGVIMIKGTSCTIPDEFYEEFEELIAWQESMFKEYIYSEKEEESIKS